MIKKIFDSIPINTLILVIAIITCVLAINEKAYCATFDAGHFVDSGTANIGNSNLIGNWSDDWNFSVNPVDTVKASAQISWTSRTTADIQAEVINVITLTREWFGTQANANFSLVAGNYTLRVSGISTMLDSYAGTLEIEPVSTSIPGAALLFGSALVGLIGMDKRKCK